MNAENWEQHILHIKKDIIMQQCDKCHKEIKEQKDYGGLCIEYGKHLCKECWVKWLEMRNRHYQEINRFFEGE